MDLQKIGKYIAGKRKRLGLTQKQLAEQLGMSDKSVSKWVSGVSVGEIEKGEVGNNDYVYYLSFEFRK